MSRKGSSPDAPDPEGRIPYATLNLGPCWLQSYIFAIINPIKDLKMIIFYMAPTGKPRTLGFRCLKA